MKKTFLLSLVSLLILSCISLTACNSHTLKNDNSQYNTNKENDGENIITGNDNYVISILAGVENGIFKSTHVLNESNDRTTEIFSNPILSTLQLGNSEISAYKTEIIHASYNETISVFLSADNNVEYRVNSIGDCFTIIAKNNSVLYPYDGDEISETAMVTTIKNHLSSFVDISDMDCYTMNCRTSVIVTSSNFSWREDKEGYYVVPNDLVSTEKVMNYQYHFDKYCNGYKTSDSIVVKCSSTGDILSITYSNFGVDWEKFNVNEEKLNGMVDSYLTDAIISEYTINIPP